MFNKDTKLSEITDAKAFKVNWRSLQKVNNVCSVEGLKSKQCKDMYKELGIDLVDV